MKAPSDWELLKKMIADALELEPGARGAFLDTACGDNATLRARVEGLLHATVTGSGFLDSPPVVEFSQDEPETDGLVGQRIGSYQIVRRLGRGGMGTVYEALQESPRRSVALKVMLDGLGTEKDQARFRYEAQILGRLKHPAVAQVFEAGVWSGDGGTDLPYFVMELVDGASLLIAATRAGLDRRARLELFIEICDGVQHAHQNGVIHRDLKPENILLTQSGHPKILDFGIARLTGDDEVTLLRTAVGEVFGTIAYMSPEQVRGEPDAIDTRTDVYALGVILQQLLTGQFPLSLSEVTVPEAIRRILEVEPTPLGRIDPSCRGDLETIVATALAKEKERRYSSASELARDVRRTLDDQAITARPASAMYQISKFARRHRGLVSGLVAAFLALVIGVVGTGYGLFRATRARDAAEQAREEAEAGSGFLRHMLGAVDPHARGRDVTVLEVLDQAALDVERSFRDQPNVRASLHSTLGWTYYNLGNLAAAQRELKRSTTLYRELHGAAHDRTIEEENRLVQVLIDSGAFDGAAASLAKIEGDAGSLGDAHPVQFGLLSSRASLQAARGELVASEASYRKLVELQVASYGERDESVLGTRNDLAGVLRMRGNLAGAEELFQQVYDVRLESQGSSHPDTVLSGMNLALAVDGQGRGAAAETLFRELLPTAVSVWGAEHPHVFTLKNNLAACLTQRGQLAEAETLSRASLAGYTKLFDRTHEGAIAALNNLTLTLGYARRPDEAEPFAREVFGILQDKWGGEHHEALTAAANLAGILSDLGKFAEAEPLTRKSLEQEEKTLGTSHPKTLIARNNYAHLLGSLDRQEESLILLRRNLELAKAAQPGHPTNTVYFAFNLGQCLFALERGEEARPYVVAARDLAAEHWEADHPHRQKIERVLAELDAAVGP